MSHRQRWQIENTPGENNLEIVSVTKRGGDDGRDFFLLFLLRRSRHADAVRRLPVQKQTRERKK